MSKAETAVNTFGDNNCAQSVLRAFADRFKLDTDTALQVAVGFGAGFGRHQSVCGAISGAVMVLGLASKFTKEDGRPKINEVYATVHRFINDFSAKEGAVTCRDLLKCDLTTEEGMAYFREHNLRENCKGYIKTCCELLDQYLEG